jgi:two-component system LytT family sensor kinase
MGINFAVMQRIKPRFFIEILLHALFWLVMYYALNGLTISSFQYVDSAPGRDTIRMDGRALFPYAWIVLCFLMLLFYGSIFWLFKKTLHYKSSYVRAAVITAWLVLLYSSNYLLIHELIGTKYPQLFVAPKTTRPIVTRSFKPGLHPDLRVRLIPDPPNIPDPGTMSDNWSLMQMVMALAFLSILGIAAGYFFIKEWIRNELLRSEAEALQLSTEIRFLRAQVNPHFFFNTLNNLFSLAQKRGSDDLADGIAKLSGMMRYMIYEGNTDIVSLQKEIEYLQDCIALNKLRYAGDEVSVSFTHPDAITASAIQIAPMLFVPFLENAFKHGVTIGQHSDIALSLSTDENLLTFICENSDHRAVKKLEEKKGGIGLENVRRRLQLLYPGRHSLRAGPENGKYLVNLQIHLA